MKTENFMQNIIETLKGFAILFILLTLICCGMPISEPINEPVYPKCAVKDSSGSVGPVTEPEVIDAPFEIELVFTLIDSVENHNQFIQDMMFSVNENEAFRGRYKFSHSILFTTEHITMKDLIDDRGFQLEGKLWDMVETGKLYVFLTTSDISTGGYTYIPPDEEFARTAKIYQYVVIGDNVRDQPEALVHELGHFYGLPHYFSGHRSCCNYMNYVDCMTSFTKPQLDTIYHYAEKVKYHLIRR